MSLFEFLTVAISIVLALGLVRLIHGLRLASGGQTLYWVHLGYVIILIVFHLLFWWRLWGFREGVNWNFAVFVFVFIGPMLLYSLATTLIPDDASSVTSWRDHFYGVHRAFFLAWAGYTVQQFVMPIAVEGVPPRPTVWPGFAAGFLLSLAGAFSKSSRVHSALVVALSVVLLLFVAFTLRPAVPR